MYNWLTAATISGTHKHVYTCLYMFMQPPHLLSGEEEDDEVETRVEREVLEDEDKDKQEKAMMKI